MNAMHRRGFLRIAVGTILVVPAGRFLVACSDDNMSQDNNNPNPTDPPAAPPQVDGSNVIFSSSLTEAHFHTFSIANTDLQSPSGPLSGNTSTEEAHFHSVSVSMAQLANVAAGQTIQVTTGSEPGHSHVLTLLKLSGASMPDGGAGGGGGGGGGGGTGTLQNGVPVTGLSGALNSKTSFTMAIPAGATNLKFAMSGGTGDADMYVKFGSAPTTSSYDCRPYINGNSESCSFTTPSTGTYYVMMNGYSAYSGVTLTGTFTTGGGTGDPFLTNGVPVSSISGTQGSLKYWRITTPAAKILTVRISGGSGDADLYVRPGSRPTTTAYSCRPYLTGNSETCTISSTQAGDYYIMLRGYAAYSGVTLLGSF